MVKKSSVANVAESALPIAESALPIEAPSKTPKAFVIVGTPPSYHRLLGKVIVIVDGKPLQDLELMIGVSPADIDFLGTNIIIGGLSFEVTRL